MADFDFYKELGVSKGSSDDDIKKAYRKLARELHPDVNDEPEAEERFKRVSEAYAVLSDPEKKSLYDSYGVDGLRDGFDPKVYERYKSGGFEGASINLEDLFGGFSGFGGGFSGFGGGGFGGFGGGKPRAGADLELLLRVPFDKAVSGFSEEISYDAPGICPTCKGRGGRDGMVCATCRGAGVVNRQRSIKFKVPKGADDGDRIRLRGKGGTSRPGAAPSDLVLVLQVPKDSRFERDGIHLTTKVSISPLDAILGTELEVRGLESSLTFRVPAGVVSGSKIRLRGQGIERGSKTGDLFAELVIDPRLLSLDEEALVQLRAIRDAAQALQDSSEV